MSKSFVQPVDGLFTRADLEAMRDQGWHYEGVFLVGPETGIVVPDQAGPAPMHVWTMGEFLLFRVPPWQQEMTVA